jgi:hypothetical protein
MRQGGGRFLKIHLPDIFGDFFHRGSFDSRRDQSQITKPSLPLGFLRHVDGKNCAVHPQRLPCLAAAGKFPNLPEADRLLNGNRNQAGANCGALPLSAPWATSAIATTATKKAKAIAAIACSTRPKPPRAYISAIIEADTPDTMKVSA